MSGLILSAPASGSGKTTITLGLLRALALRGVRVRAAKSGPDYIDARFHEAACGAPCTNLDAWAMTPARIAALASGTGTLIVEGAMGLFDGAPPDSRGATADLARILRLPVVLVIDAARMAGSVAALAEGFARHDPMVPVAGVILNAIGSPRHEAMLRRALAPAGLPVLGAVPRLPDLAHPARHLGLVQAQERPDLDAFLTRAAALAEAHLDIDALMALAARAPAPQGSAPQGSAPQGSAPQGSAPQGSAPQGSAPQGSAPQGSAPRLAPPAQRIAIAQDAAFAFAYPHLLADWQAAGAEVTPFSPLADDPVPPADLVFLPGGYPELHAGRIAAATTFIQSLKSAAQNTDIYGECGGYMVLGHSLTDAAGTVWPMAGLLDLATSFASRRLHLGYRELHAAQGLLAGRWAGHEFHYATTAQARGAPLFAATDAEGNALPPMGLRAGRVCGSFAHLIDRRG